MKYIIDTNVPMKAANMNIFCLANGAMLSTQYTIRSYQTGLWGLMSMIPFLKSF